MSLSPLLRYTLVAVIIGVIGGLFVVREFGGSAAEDMPAVLDAGQRPVVGQTAPDFVLEALGTGEPVRLSDFRGQTVVLNFWATWCAPCRAEMPEFQEAYDARLQAGDLVFLAVNFQEVDVQVQRFVDEFSLTFPVVMDRDGDVRRHYQVLGLPATFFIDRDGILRSQNLGPVFGRLLQDGISAADRGGAQP